MTLKQRLKSRAGFTLAETLLAVLILLLVSTIVATGIPVAKDAYQKVVVAANAQLLLSTTATALRDELGTAWDVKINSKTTKSGVGTTTIEKSVSYYSADTGARSELYADGTGIRLREYSIVPGINADDATGKLDDRLLVSEEASDTKEKLIATYTDVEKSGDYIVFSGLSVKKGKTVLAALTGKLKIKVLWGEDT